MEIYYQDKDIIVCHKPYGVASEHNGGEGMPDMISALTLTQVFPVHRLDITTEGIMVFALNKQSAASLCAQAADHRLEKSYYAVVHGNTPEHGEMVDYLYHDKSLNKSYVVKGKRGGAKEARLEYSTIGGGCVDNSELSLVDIRLYTGRSHQIRVQFASRSHPLYGDRKYGAKSNGKIMLYAHSLGFFHPVSGKRMVFEAKHPSELFGLIGL